MASCVGNIRTKNYQNLIIGFKLQSKMSGMLFWDTVYMVCSCIVRIAYNICGLCICDLSGIPLVVGIGVVLGVTAGFSMLLIVMRCVRRYIDHSFFSDTVLDCTECTNNSVYRELDKLSSVSNGIGSDEWAICIFFIKGLQCSYSTLITLAVF